MFEQLLALIYCTDKIKCVRGIAGEVAAVAAILFASGNLVLGLAIIVPFMEPLSV